MISRTTAQRQARQRIEEARGQGLDAFLELASGADVPTLAVLTNTRELHRSVSPWDWRPEEVEALEAQAESTPELAALAVRVLRRREAWGRYLRENGWRGDPCAEALGKTLLDPARVERRWFAHAREALLANRWTGGEIWASYLRDGALSYASVVAAVQAHERHTRTDYEARLRSGQERTRARRSAQALPEGDRTRFAQTPWGEPYAEGEDGGVWLTLSPDERRAVIEGDRAEEQEEQAQAEGDWEEFSERHQDLLETARAVGELYRRTLAVLAGHGWTVVEQKQGPSGTSVYAHLRLAEGETCRLRVAPHRRRPGAPPPVDVEVVLGEDPAILVAGFRKDRREWGSRR